ncbi:TMED4 protein, partial [Catharus fuscescens]|nr:TMED4 protein [Catharus fuscescens]
NSRTQLWDKQSESFLPSTPGLGMHVEVKDPDGKVVLSRQYGSEGRFTFTSHTPGEHQICLHSNSTRMALFAGGKLVMHLGLLGTAGDRAGTAGTELEARAGTARDRGGQSWDSWGQSWDSWGQAGDRAGDSCFPPLTHPAPQYREERFRMTSESTNQRVLWWSIAQTIILILTGIWQMRHLKSFFEAKKLV